jgi:RecA-family ATPase
MSAKSAGFEDFERLPDDAYAQDEVRAKANGADAGTEAYPVERLDALIAPPRAAIVQGMGLDEGTVAAIVGQPNAGKTAFAVSLGLAIAGGAERWLNCKIRNGPTVYFAAEAPGSVTRRAKAAVQRCAYESATPIYICKSVPELGGEDTSIPDAQHIMATVARVETIEGAKVKIIFIDTVASCMGDGDENSEGMLRLVNMAKAIAAKTGVCVVLVHHPSKGDAMGLRGHSSLAGACDAIVRIEIEELTGVRIATLTKARDDATGVQLRFDLETVILEERDPWGDPQSTIVVRPSTQPKPRRRPGGKAQDQLLVELERRYRTGEQFWDKATVCKAGRDLGMHRNSAKTALDGLITAGFIAGSDARLTLKEPPECT